MKTDEFAFLNRQLAAMLRAGIPLEGALRQLCSGMSSGAWRAELEALERDLAAGAPLAEALERRRLPEFYKRMVVVGARANDLPGMLVLLADHYHRAHTLWTRLQGIMVYPLLVLVVALGLSALIATVSTRLVKELPLTTFDFVEYLHGGTARELMPIGAIWIPPLALGLVAAVVVAVFASARGRAQLRWRLPAFREASLAQVASSLGLMLRKGVPLNEALALAEGIERGTPAGRALAEWLRKVALGRGKVSEWPVLKPFPPLFVWLVQQAGEDLAGGFEQAAAIYRARAAHRIELALYGALPISILLLGQMVLWQMIPVMQRVVWMMRGLSG